MKKDGRKYVALVTGATGGLGTAMVKHMVDDGYLCVANYHTKSKAEKWNEEMKEQGYDVPMYHADVSDFESVGKMIEKIQNDIGTVDILVNNAGITRDGVFKRMTFEQWDAVMKTNLYSAFNCTRHVINPMIDQEFGRIINISSVVGVFGNAGQANYAAAKAGIIGFSKSVAKEVGSRNVRCNAIAPGFIETDMTHELSDENREQFLAGIPLKRLGQANEVADVCAFLGSDLSTYVTGQTLSVCGGLNT